MHRRRTCGKSRGSVIGPQLLVPQCRALGHHMCFLTLEDRSHAAAKSHEQRRPGNHQPREVDKEHPCIIPGSIPGHHIGLQCDRMTSLKYETLRTLAGSLHTGSPEDLHPPDANSSTRVTRVSSSRGFTLMKKFTHQAVDINAIPWRRCEAARNCACSQAAVAKSLKRRL